MTQKNKKLWQLVMLLAADLALLIFISAICSSNARAMHMGCSGERVAEVQQALIRNGYFSGKASGIYCIKTGMAVRKFQQDANISSSGKADFETLERLGISSRTAPCFSAEVELLARCIQQSSTGYGEMLKTAQEILGKTKAARTLGSYVCDFYPNAFYADEPSSAAYAAALQAIREQ